MEGDLGIRFRFDCYLPRLNKLVDKLRMVNYLIIPAEGRVFLADRMEAMGARGNDTFGSYLVEQLDIRGSQLVEKVFISRAAS